MATRICDVEPCDRMRMALRSVFDIEQPYDPEKGMLLVKMLKMRSNVVQEMNFKYCPFCGTRIVLGLVDAILEERTNGNRLRP